MNEQIPIKLDYKRNGVTKPLLVNSIFYTIQGEGPFAGYPAVFLRFAGCNLKCHYCDTLYTESTERKVLELTQEIRDLCEEKKTNLVVITGGESLAQSINYLVEYLHESGIQVQIETSGSVCPPDFPFHLCTVVCSPKTGKLNKQMVKAHYWKYVVQMNSIDSDDCLPNKSTQVIGVASEIARPMNDNPVYVSPCDEDNFVSNKRNLKLVAAIALKKGYRVSLQTHKILEVE